MWTRAGSARRRCSRRPERTDLRRPGKQVQGERSCGQCPGDPWGWGCGADPGTEFEMEHLGGGRPGAVGTKVVTSGASRERLDKIRTKVWPLDPAMRKSRTNTAPPPSESPEPPWTPPQPRASQVPPRALRWTWQERGPLPDLPHLVGVGRAASLGDTPPPRTGGETQQGGEPCWGVGRTTRRKG